MSDENESLAEVLGGSSAFHDAPAVVQPKAEPQLAQIEDKAQVRDDSGKFAEVEPKGVPTEVKADPKVDKPELQPADVAAIIDERRKRQALEREVAELRQRMPQQEAPKPPPSVFEDEDGAFSQRTEAIVAPLRGILLDQSVQLAKLHHKDDWQEAEEAFHEAVAADPSLAQRFRGAQNPGEFVYQAGVYHREMSKYGGSVVPLRDAIRGESAGKLSEAQTRIQALETELASLKTSRAEVDSVSRSLNGRSSRVVDAETQTDPDDLASLTRFGKG